MKGSNRLRKSEAVLNFNNLNLNDDEGPQYQFINWMFSPFLGGIFGLHKLEALLSLFDPESLQTAFVNWVSVFFIPMPAAAPTTTPNSSIIVF